MSVAEPAASALETVAAERLYERHSSRVFGYCLRMLGSREHAEDGSQTTFMQVPEVPELPGLPDVPDVPDVPGVPELPKLPN